LLCSRTIGSWALRKTFLLVSSYIFYAAWNPPFVVLLWISTIADWFIAKKIFNEKNKIIKKLFLFCSILINLGLLAYFKYGIFILNNFIFLLKNIGIIFQPPEISIILPVGISFYTFQTLSYSFDIYNGQTKPWFSFLDYALYVSFFPQLVAGPIVRSTHFLPQCIKPQKGDTNQLSWGIILFIIGLFNKVVIADAFMAPIVEKIFNSESTLTFFQSWLGAVAFSVQIFCDFSGYSTCAIGVALMLGFSLPDNFHFPYAAIGFSDFWRRWHISLSTWLRDYLYIPLGGNRKGTGRTYVNLMLTMLIGGLWHGASWLFIIWGGLHGFFLCVERVLTNLKLFKIEFWQNGVVKFGLSLFTFSLVTLAWVFFRSTDLQRAFEMILSMFGANSFQINGEMYISKKSFLSVTIIAFSMLLLHWKLSSTSIEHFFSRLSLSVKSIIITALAYCIIISLAGEDRAFIYFQF
jgi:D-alanyl-lipoteichoic acid acyltransferase DltB (MBOAT superfamily)